MHQLQLHGIVFAGDDILFDDASNGGDV